MPITLVLPSSLATAKGVLPRHRSQHSRTSESKITENQLNTYSPQSFHKTQTVFEIQGPADVSIAQNDNIQQHPKTAQNNSKILQLKHSNSKDSPSTSSFPPPKKKPGFLFALFELPDRSGPPGPWQHRPAAKPPRWRFGHLRPPSGEAFRLRIGGDRVSPREKAVKVGEDFCLQKEFVEGKKVMRPLMNFFD